MVETGSTVTKRQVPGFPGYSLNLDGELWGPKLDRPLRRVNRGRGFRLVNRYGHQVTRPANELMMQVFPELFLEAGEILVNITYRHSISNHGRVWSHHLGDWLVPFISKHGYARVNLRVDYKTIHRLVAVEFIDNVDNKPQVNHIDGNKLNNHVDNLEWCTSKENINHAIENGLRKNTGSHLRRYTEEDVILLREMFNSGFSVKQLCDLFNGSKGTICKLVHRKTWRQV